LVIPIPEPLLKGDKTRYFSIEVKGTSMTKAGIKDGDFIVMRRAEEPEDGSGKTIEVDSSDYEIQGEFVKLRVG
jgi:SOS-response transcriptional repressor LexA